MDLNPVPTSATNVKRSLIRAIYNQDSPPRKQLMSNQATLTFQVDSNDQVFVDDYGYVDVTRGNDYESDSFPFCEAADIEITLNETPRIREHLDEISALSGVALFKEIAKRIESARLKDEAASDYWQDYVTEEDVSALNDVVQAWLDEPVDPDFSTTPTNPYDYAWQLLWESHYDAEAVGMEFIEGLRPGDNQRYIFLRMDIDQANNICQNKGIGLRFERMEPTGR